MIGILGHQHLGQQSGCRDALVDDLPRNLRLGQCLAAGTDPLAAHMAFYREHAGRVVQLLRDILANALELAAALAVIALIYSSQFPTIETAAIHAPGTIPPKL